VLGARRRLPLYDERFRGYGWDKTTHAAQLRAEGFRYAMPLHAVTGFRLQGVEGRSPARAGDAGAGALPQQPRQAPPTAAGGRALPWRGLARLLLAAVPRDYTNCTQLHGAATTCCLSTSWSPVTTSPRPLLSACLVSRPRPLLSACLVSRPLLSPCPGARLPLAMLVLLAHSRCLAVPALGTAPLSWRNAPPPPPQMLSPLLHSRLHSHDPYKSRRRSRARYAAAHADGVALQQLSRRVGRGRLPAPQSRKLGVWVRWSTLFICVKLSTHVVDLSKSRNQA
jgi:hypothetical protein